MDLFVEDDDGKITDESFVHCFEGTITAVSENGSGCSRSIFGESSKWAVATNKWDVEFLAWGEVGHHALDPRLYGKEDVNGGSNILNDDYVAMQCLEDKFEELVQKFKQTNYGGDADMTAVCIHSCDDWLVVLQLWRLQFRWQLATCPHAACRLYAEYAVSAVCILFHTYWHSNSGNQLIFINITRQSK
jgi:hypothetical protein